VLLLVALWVLLRVVNLVKREQRNEEVSLVLLGREVLLVRKRDVPTSTPGQQEKEKTDLPGVSE